MESVKDYYILYPVYIDSTKKMSEGRKYNKDLCIDKPTFLEIYNALKHLEIESIPEQNKKHPRDFFRFGRFKIKKMYGKKNLMEGVKYTISKMRLKSSKNTASSTESQPKKAPEYVITNKGEVIENKLNLVAKRKIKPKKGKKK
ncbi:hypothetical protein P3W45_000297 [Vairimorpha bombi]|jgi:signal recognition particle subunit SRP19